MNEIESIIAQLERQKAAIEKAVAALREVSGLPTQQSKAPEAEASNARAGKTYISPEGRGRIAEATRKRWAAKRAAERKAASASSSRPGKKTQPAKKKAA